ncbi:MAG: hypothetical protein R6X23_11855 [Acidimicrobiia bacterium]
MNEGYWPSRWPGEDGGPARRQRPATGTGLAIAPGERLDVVSRDAMASTMVVLRDPGEAYLLCHTAGDDAVSWVERFHPETLEVLERSEDLPGGRTWPGGIAAHANGSLHVVFGRHAHRLAADCTRLATTELPRAAPYNSFVVLPDGHLATKDFGGLLPGETTETRGDIPPAELLVLEPDRLEIVARLELPEPSVARISADDADIYVVGVDHLLRIRWDGTRLALDADFQPRYRTLDGQTYGWDAVLDAGAAWFLDNGAGSEGYAGTFRGRGISPAPLHLVRVDLASGAVGLTEICGRPFGVVANPPAIDAGRQIAVGYDSANRVLAAFDFDDAGATSPRWRREQDHACHPILFPDTGELVTNDHDAERMMDQVVVLDVETGEERARADTGSPVQSVLFPAPGFGRDLYCCSFTTLSRVTVAPAPDHRIATD